MCGVIGRTSEASHLFYHAGWPSCRRGPERRLGQICRISSCFREASLGCKSQPRGWKLSVVCAAPRLCSPHERRRCDDISLWSLVSRGVPQKTDSEPHVSHLYQEQLRNWKHAFSALFHLRQELRMFVSECSRVQPHTETWCLWVSL